MTPSFVSVVDMYVFVPLSVVVVTSKLVEDVEWHPARANAATKAPVIAKILSDFIFSLLLFLISIIYLFFVCVFVLQLYIRWSGRGG